MRLRTTAALVLAALALAGCGGGSSDESAGDLLARAKTTLAVVVAPPSALKPQPIPPSADWRIDLARGCPAHCQYCYLAGSLGGPPITRVYANLDEILGNLDGYVGSGTITTPSAERHAEGVWPHVAEARERGRGPLADASPRLLGMQ